MRTIMVLLQLFWQMCQLKKLHPASQCQFCSSRAHRHEMHCKSMRKVEEKQPPLPQAFTTKLQQNFSNTLRYMKGNHWIERILSRSTHANFFRNWVIHMNWVSERCSTNEQTIDTSVQPSGSLISKGTVSDAYAHGPLETEMFITNATNEWPHGCPAKKKKENINATSKKLWLKLRATTTEWRHCLLYSCNWLSYMISVQWENTSRKLNRRILSSITKAYNKL